MNQGSFFLMEGGSMKIERINSDRLQITLTYADMSEHDIDFGKLCENREELNKFISFLLVRAKLDTGFDLYHGQFLIRAVQSEKDLVFTIIRITEEAKNAVKKAAVRSGARFRLVEAKEETEEEKDRTLRLLVKFGHKEDFAAMIMQLEHEVNDDWKLYCENNIFYLDMKVVSSDLPPVYSIAVEFGEILLDDPQRLILLEGHDSLLAQGKAIIRTAELY